MVTLNDLFRGMEDILSKLKQKYTAIESVNDLAMLTDTESEREALSEQLSVPYYQIYYVSKLANILQCADLSLEDAEFLVKTGIRSINDLKKINTDQYVAFLQNNGYTMKSRAVDAAVVNAWIFSAMNVSSDFEEDAANLANASYLYSLSKSNRRSMINARTPSTSMGIDLADIITELGVGLANAQRALDQNSIDMQKKILDDPQLRAFGLNATWFTIPETSFSLKMEYAFSEESSEDIKKGPLTRPRRLKVIPANATYKNTYNTSGTTESTLNLRLVPIPAPEGVTDTVLVPNLVGMDIDAAVETLTGLGLFYRLNLIQQGSTQNGKGTEILRQSLPDGTTLFSQDASEPKSEGSVIAYSEIVLDYVQQQGETNLSPDASRAVVKNEYTRYQLKLLSVGDQKVAVIKIVRELTGMGLKESKDLVESTPSLLDCNLSKDVAESYVRRFAEVGAAAVIKGVE